jgi:hypothetical protein
VLLRRAVPAQTERAACQPVVPLAVERVGDLAGDPRVGPGSRKIERKSVRQGATHTRASELALSGGVRGRPRRGLSSEYLGAKGVRTAEPAGSLDRGTPTCVRRKVSANFWGIPARPRVRTALRTLDEAVQEYVANARLRPAA